MANRLTGQFGAMVLVTASLVATSTLHAEHHWDTLSELHAMEKRLLDASGLCLEFEITSSGAVESSLKGATSMRRPNNARITARGEFAGADADIVFRTHLGRMFGQNGKQRFEDEAPTGLTEGIVIGLTRMGLLHNLAVLSTGAPPDRIDGTVKRWVRPGDIRAGENVEEDGRRLGSYTFTVIVADQPSGEATLWYDADTGLPVRREQVVQFDAGEMRVNERYKNVDIECEIR